jgi:hypothetical protein
MHGNAWKCKQLYRWFKLNKQLIAECPTNEVGSFQHGTVLSGLIAESPVCCTLMIHHHFTELVVTPALMIADTST